LSKKDLNIKFDELSSALGTFKGLQISIGKIIDEENFSKDTNHITCQSVIFVVYAPLENVILQATRKEPVDLPKLLNSHVLY